MTPKKAISSFRERGHSPRWTFVSLAAGLLVVFAACAPQERASFEARLTPFPVIGGNAGGIGSATATLSGTTLEVTGSFEGLTFRAGRGAEEAPSLGATAALHSSQVTAIAGDSFADLTVEGDGDAGTISGSVELTAEQVEMLRNGQIYAQINSEDAPGGHLWGWFLQ